jgi:hypothetical protein
MPPKKTSSRKQRTYHKRYCHTFVCAVLLTPCGMRIPLCRSYYTHEYALAHGKTHKSESDLGAELVKEFPWPKLGRRLVLGDTAYESKAVQKACRKVGAQWIVPINPERRLAGPQGQRQLVRSRIKDFKPAEFQTIRFCPGQGSLAIYRRPSLSRQGRANAKTMIEYHAATQLAQVHNIGSVRLVFSCKEAPENQGTADVSKLLMSNATELSATEIVELYSLRWQIELFFKELKSDLGMDHYQFDRFVPVENWVPICLLTFGYLEFYRSKQLMRKSLTAESRRWWLAQRCCGISRQVMQAIGEADLVWIYQNCQSERGRRRVRACWKNSLPKDHQEPKAKPKRKPKPKAV